MTWLWLDTWIVVVGILCALSTGLLGNFLVLRRMSMMGDAISHAVLPGLAIGYLLTGERTSVWLFIGAVLTGLLTAFFTTWINRNAKVEHGASMGIVFTSLFAIGLILMVGAAGNVELDASCVLFGAIELTPLDVAWQVSLGGVVLEIPRAALVLSVVLIINLLVILLFFKEWRLTSFDPDMATANGFSAGLMHYLLMALTAVTTVAAFEAVGSIIVIAMLIVPPAAAHLLTDRLVPMLIWTALIGIASALLGHLAALTIPPLFGFEDASSAGMMGVVAGCLFTLAALSTPLRRRT